MNNESKKPEKLKPQDSESRPADNEEKAVVKNHDKSYHRDEANFPDPAKKRENDEQPVHPVKEEPKD